MASVLRVRPRPRTRHPPAPARGSQEQRAMASPEGWKGFKNILVAVDFSESARDAFETALGLAREASAKLTALHVYNPPIMFPDGNVWPGLVEQLAADAKKTLEQ